MARKLASMDKINNRAWLAKLNAWKINPYRRWVQHPKRNYASNDCETPKRKWRWKRTAVGHLNIIKSTLNRLIWQQIYDTRLGYKHRHPAINPWSWRWIQRFIRIQSDKRNAWKNELFQRQVCHNWPRLL